MMRCDSGKRSSPSEHEDAELIYLKDNVAIHPTQFASERISGRLKLTKQDSVLFLVINHCNSFVKSLLILICFHIFLILNGYDLRIKMTN